MSSPVQQMMSALYFVSSWKSVSSATVISFSNLLNPGVRNRPNHGNVRKRSSWIDRSMCSRQICRRGRAPSLISSVVGSSREISHATQPQLV
jgi:hypothetical protein